VVNTLLASFALGEQRTLSDDAPGNVDVDHDDARLAGTGIARGMHQVPALERGAVTGVLERELGQAACDDRAQAGGRFHRRRFPHRGIGYSQIVLLASARDSAIIDREPRPRTIGHDDLPLRVEHRDVRHQRVERRLKEVA